MTSFHFSLFSFLAAIIQVYIGIYALSKDHKSIVNRLFFIQSITISIWSFSYVFLFMSTTAEECMTWYKLSSVGWCFTFSSLLHFILALTKENKLLKKWWVLLLIWLPSIIFFFKSISTGLNTAYFIKINDIWFPVNDSSSPWFWLFLTYYLFSFAASIYLLRRWVLRSGYSATIQKQANTIIISCLATLLGGAITSTFLPILHIHIVPTLAHVFGIVWTLGIFVSITKYKMMVLTPAIAAEEIISKIKDVLILVNPLGRIIKVNLPAEELLTYSEKELLGLPYNEILYEKTLIPTNLFKEYTPFDTYNNVELKLKTKNGNYIPANITSSIIKNETDEMIGVVFVAQDIRQTKRLIQEITERKEAEKIQRILYKISDAATLTQSTKELFEQIYKNLKNFIITKNFYIALYHNDTKKISFPFFIDEIDSAPQIKDFGRGLPEYVIRTKKPLLATSEKISELITEGEVELIGKPAKIWLGVPLKVSDKVVGIIVVQTYDNLIRFDHKDEDLLIFASEQIAMSIERKNSEVALRLSEEHYRDIFENARDLIYTLDLEGNFTSINQIANKYFGYSAKDLIGKNISELLTSESLTRARKYSVAKLIKNNDIINYEVQAITKNNNAITLDINSLLRFRDGKPYEIFGIARDITERKITEIHLKENEARLRKAEKLAKIGSLEIDIRTNQLTCSKTIFEIFNIKEKNKQHEFDFEQLNALIIEEDKHLFVASYEDILAYKNKEFNIVFRISGGSADIKYISAIGILENNATENNAHLHITLQDISEQKKNEELLKVMEVAERSAELKQQFLTNMSHEIRTPLNAIVGFSELMKRTPLNKKQERFLQNIRNSSDHLSIVINDILDFSKISAGKLKIETIDFNPREIIHRIISTMNVKAIQKSLTLSYHFDENIPPILIGDPLRLSQIILNLTDNAIKFTGEKGSVNIDLRVIEIDHNNCVIRFTLKDNGIGIPLEKQDSIFESFTQADSNTTRKYGGTGLGLSIVKQLIELQGGSIKIESEAGSGTTFIFDLRFKISLSKHEIKIEEVSIGMCEMHPKRLSILIVEDNEINQQLALDTIAEWNSEFLLEIANNGQEAIEKVKVNHFDLLLMDIQMPVMDGYKAACTIRQLPSPKCLIPIIAMTAHALEDEKDKCIAAGLNDYLSKPFTPSELYKKIRRFTCIDQIKLIQKGKNIDANIICKYDKNSNTFYSEKIQKEYRQKPQLNMDYLTKLYKGNSLKILKMLHLFNETLPLEIETLTTCYINHDWINLQTKAHSLKPTMLYLGLPELHHAAKEIELLAKKEREDLKIEHTISYIQEIWKDIHPELHFQILKFGSEKS